MAHKYRTENFPLSKHELIQSTDLDCAREQVARIFCPHRLEINGDRRPFRMRHHHFMGDMISLNYMEYGADISIDPGALKDFYLIQIPLDGFATARNGHCTVHADRSTASVLNPHWESRMRWSEGCRQILLQIKRAPFQAFANRVFDRELPGAVTFNPQFDLARPAAARWLKRVSSLFAAVEDLAGDCAPNTLTWHLNEQVLTETFLLLQPSNMSIFLENKPHRPCPRHLRRAREFIREKADQPITLSDISAVAGCSTRALQLAYQAVYSTTPLQALKFERLRRARFDFLNPTAKISVGEIATKWGFNHLGRFADEYRAAFGELPRQTLAAPDNYDRALALDALDETPVSPRPTGP